GCLSVDEDHPGHVYRHYKIRVKAFDILNNEEVEINTFGYPAIVLQHEIDHLHGVLFYDRINEENKVRYPDALSL
ncbi:MAG TPA: peptide deformylase, partial [Bacilli bacterium]|nr:peptide deformylase [Bacilli bacterium]